MLPTWPRFFYTWGVLFSISILFMQVSCIHPSGLLSDVLSHDLHSMEWILNYYFINHNNKIVIHIATGSKLVISYMHR